MPSFKGGPKHHPALIRQWRDGELCDMRIIVDGQIFAVHRNIVAAASDFMAACFRAGTSDSSGRMELKEMRADAFESTLEYIYTGKCEVPEPLLLAVLEVAVRLQMKGLENEVEEAALASLTPENSAEMRVVADRLSLSRLSISAQYGVLLQQRFFDEQEAKLCVMGGYDYDRMFCHTRGELGRWAEHIDLGAGSDFCAADWLPETGEELVAIIPEGRKLYLFGAKSVTCFDPLSGTRREIGGFKPRSIDGHLRRYAVARLGDKVYLAGGETSSVECLDLRTETWLKCPSMVHRRESPQMVALGGKLYVLGGKGSTYDYYAEDETLRSMEVLEPDAEAETPIPEEPPEPASKLPRGLAPPVSEWGMLSVDHPLIKSLGPVLGLGGGPLPGSMGQPGGWMAQPEASSEPASSTEPPPSPPRKGRWVVIPMPQAREGMAAAAMGDEIIIAGGPMPFYSCKKETDGRLVDAYNVTNGTWRSLPPLNHGREHPGLIAHQQKLYAVGGQMIRPGNPIFGPRHPDFVDVRKCEPNCRYAQQCAADRARYPTLQPRERCAMNSVESYDPSGAEGAWEEAPASTMRGHRSVPVLFHWRHAPDYESMELTWMAE